MKRDVRDRLAEPYPADRTDSPEVARWKALGVDVFPVRQLRTRVINESTGSFGVRWWEGLDAPRRILLSEYLIAALHSVSINLGEAALHREELEQWRVEERVAIAVLREGTRPTAFHPRGASVYEDIATAYVDLHAAGFFRAIGSTLDCLAAVSGIVCGVRMPALKLDFRSLTN